MAMMVKMLKTVAVPGRLLKAGQVVSVSDSTGARLVAEKAAEAVKAAEGEAAARKDGK